MLKGIERPKRKQKLKKKKPNGKKDAADDTRVENECVKGVLKKFIIVTFNGFTSIFFTVHYAAYQNESISTPAEGGRSENKKDGG